MKLILKLLLSLCFAGALQALETGKPAPDLSLIDADGNTQTLSQFKGKLVVLEWINEGCPFVRKHYSGNMQALQRKSRARGSVWLSICSSAKGKQGYWATGAEANAFRQRSAAAMSAILLDPDGTVGHLYGAKTTPHMFVIDKAGILVYQGAIDNRPSTRANDIAGATNWVSQALDELAAGKSVSVSDTKPYGCSVKYKK